MKWILPLQFSSQSFHKMTVFDPYTLAFDQKYSEMNFTILKKKLKLKPHWAPYDYYPCTSCAQLSAWKSIGRDANWFSRNDPYSETSNWCVSFLKKFSWREYCYWSLFWPSGHAQIVISDKRTTAVNLPQCHLISVSPVLLHSQTVSLEANNKDSYESFQMKFFHTLIKIHRRRQ